MPHRVETSPSGRARCRGCKKKIDKGELRFSVAVPNPFGEGESFHHYHLGCAALRQPEAFLQLAVPNAEEAEPDGEVDAPAPTPGQLEELAKHLAKAELSAEHRRLRRFVRAERASSGRARCRHCREVIEKGEVRLALEIVDEGMANAAGFIHVGCAPAYVGTTEHLFELIRLQTEDESIELEELEAQLAPS